MVGTGRARSLGSSTAACRGRPSATSAGAMRPPSDSAWSGAGGALRAVPVSEEPARRIAADSAGAAARPGRRSGDSRAAALRRAPERGAVAAPPLARPGRDRDAGARTACCRGRLQSVDRTGSAVAARAVVDLPQRASRSSGAAPSSGAAVIDTMARRWRRAAAPRPRQSSDGA